MPPRTSEMLSMGVVVLSYNGLQDTLACLDSLKKTTPLPRHIVLVDNGSTDGSAAVFHNRFKADPGITLLVMNHNRGYAGGMNQGIRYLLQHTTVRSILLLNNDTLIRPTALAALAESLRENSGWSIVTPRILYADGRTIWSTGERVIYPLLFAFRKRGLRDNPGSATPKGINCITGCAMAVKSEVFDKIGLFDENYFAYVEEIDFCKRAVDAGFRLTCCMDSVVIHRVGGVLGEHSPRQIYLNVRNKAYFLKKNIPHHLWILSAVWYLITVLTWLLKGLVAGNPGVVRCILKGMRDFLQGRMGQPFWVRN